MKTKIVGMTKGLLLASATVRRGPQDSDPEETSEWQESLRQLVDARGAGRGREIIEAC